MSYVLSKPNAEYGAKLMQKMLEAFAQGNVVTLETDKRNVGYVALKAHEGIAALKVFPELTSEEGQRLLVSRAFIVSSDPQNGKVVIRPRRRTDSVTVSITKAADAVFDEVSKVINNKKEVDLDCAGTRLMFAHDWMPALGALQRGVRRLVNVEVPNKPEAMEGINNIMSGFGFKIVKFNPPAEVVFDKVEVQS